MPFCPFCGSTTEDEANFCSQCGKKTPATPSLPPPSNRKKQWPIVPILITLLLCLGLVVTVWRLLPYVAEQKKYSGQMPAPAATTAPEMGSQFPDNPADIARQLQSQAEDTVDVVFGRDDVVGTLKFRAPKLTASMEEVERSNSYQYKEENCTDLFSDVFQQAALAVAHEVTEATSISAEEENTLGNTIAQTIALEYKGKLDRPEDSSWLQYVNKLGFFLIKGAKRHGIAWEFHVIHENTVNAFAIPGGNIYVYTGLLEKVENEAQLAGILAHEIAHVDMRHCVAVYQVLNKMPEAVGDMAFVVASLAKHPFQGRVESEADRYGLERIYEVGYSPAQIVRFWENQGEGQNRLLTKDKDLLGVTFGQITREVDNIISDHPDAVRRACLLRNHAIQLYKMAPRELYYVGQWNLQARRPFFEEAK